VGTVPADWDVKSLLEIADGKKELFDDGDWVEAQYLTESGIRLVQTGNIGIGEFIEKQPKKYISATSFDVLNCKSLQIGDLLICRLAEPAGRACILPDIGEQRLITAVDVTIFRPSPHIADRRYLVAVFSTLRWFARINERCGGTTRTRISRGQLGKVVVPLPPPMEQRAIADALSDVDALLDGLDQLIAKKRDLKQAAMQQLLTGQTRLPGFTVEWQQKRLGDHVMFLRHGSNSRAELLPEGQVKYLHYGDIHACASAYLDPAGLPSLPNVKAATLDRLEDGDLVLADASEDVAGVGKSVEMKDVGDAEVVAGMHTIAARFDKNVLADGFKGLLQFCPEFAKHLRRLAAGTKVYATNRAYIASVGMRLPPVEEQSTIAGVLADMDAEITALEARRAKIRDLKQAMMQELLTGKTRLV
jgi:type I restriction enzyme S subunit